MPRSRSLTPPRAYSSPADLTTYYQSEAFVEKYGGETVFRQLFAPKSRTLILDALLAAEGDPRTADQIAAWNDDLSVSGFNRHRDALLELGVMIEAGKVGNAMTYRLNEDHPVAQLLAMLGNVTFAGETPMTLDPAFLADGE